MVGRAWFAAALAAALILSACAAPAPVAEPPAASITEPTAEPTAAPTEAPTTSAALIAAADDHFYGFEPNSGAELTTVYGEGDDHSGDGYGLLVKASRQYGGASVDISGLVEPGGKYEISVWVKLISPASHKFNASLQLAGPQYPTLIPDWGVYCYKDVWTQLKGTYAFSEATDGARVVAQVWDYREGSEVEFLVDDVTVTKLETHEQLDLPPIKEAYAGYFMSGAATAASYYSGGKLALLKRHFDIITPENEFKPAGLFNEGAARIEDIDTATADKLIDAAVANGFLIHGHTLIWHSQTAAWLNTKTENGQKAALDAETARANMRAFIEFAMKHFGERAQGGLVSYDVVNEAFSDATTGGASPGSGWRKYLRGTEAAGGAAVSGEPNWWYYAIGDTYIEEAFLLAYEAAPEVKRFYNDYNLDNPGKAQAVANMVIDINERYREKVGGNLIQGVGMQGHYSLATSPAAVERSIKLFIDAGVDVAFSELDVMIEGYGNPQAATPERLERQAKLYGELYGVFVKYAEHIDRVTLWGIDDDASWRRQYSPLLFDGELAAKPAFYAVIDAVK